MEKRTSEKIIEEMKGQIRDYLDGNITREQFGGLAEQYVTGFHEQIECTHFYEVYMDYIPDLCLFYIDEPGEASEKERCFRSGMVEAYELLRDLND